MTHAQQVEKMRNGAGFVAALDQSGGSTPKALRLYGVEEDAYGSEDQMFDLMHEMRSRIVTSEAFGGDRVVGAILFEMTMDREIAGRPSAEYLWDTKGVVPFLKIDKGLEEAANGVQLMKPMPGLDATLARAKDLGIFGTKERSVIGAASASGVADIVAQQFEVGQQVLSHGMVPILEPEVSISIDDKAEAEAMLLDAIGERLGEVAEGQQIMLKLTLPEAANHYLPLIEHPKVMRVVALSGGYSRAEANDRLSQNRGMIASFSRALTEGLSVAQDDNAFGSTLDSTIQSIRDASVAG